MRASDLLKEDNEKLGEETIEFDLDQVNVQLKAHKASDPPRHSFRAVYDNKVIAMGEVQKASSDDKDNSASVEEITVNSGYRRRGVAGKIYDAIERHLGYKLVPSADLGAEGEAFWASRRPARSKQKPLIKTNIPNVRLDVSKDGANVTIHAYSRDPEYPTEYNNTIGYVVFDRDGNTLVAADLVVDYFWRKKGVATAMYDHAKSLGFTIKPSTNQLTGGKNLWASRRAKAQDQEPVWEGDQEIHK
jgi:GNAT superfamily N-acetyltransferase